MNTKRNYIVGAFVCTAIALTGFFFYDSTDAMTGLSNEETLDVSIRAEVVETLNEESPDALRPGNTDAPVEAVPAVEKTPVEATVITADQ